MIRGGSASPSRPSTTAKRLTVRSLPAAPCSASASTRTIVERSADTPPGIGSRPTVGSRQRPSMSCVEPPKPGWTTRLWMRVVVSPGVAVRTCPQVSSGAPTGSSKMSSSVLSRMTRSVGSVASLTISHASPAPALGCAVGAELGLCAGAVGAADVALGADDGEAPDAEHAARKAAPSTASERMSDRVDDIWWVLRRPSGVGTCTAPTPWGGRRFPRVAAPDYSIDSAISMVASRPSALSIR